MGIIFLALVANGNLAAERRRPDLGVVSAATAIALGTYVGGWRIIKTMGTRIIKMDPAQGFAAQGAGAAVILSASHVGFPLSTTHVISGAIMGAGAAKRRLRGALGRRRQHRRRVGAHAARAPRAVGALTYGVVRLLRRAAPPARSWSPSRLLVALAVVVRRAAWSRAATLTAEG